MTKKEKKKKEKKERIAGDHGACFHAQVNIAL